MAAINEKLRLYDETFDEKSHTDVNRLANAMLSQADILSPIVTRLYGDLDQRFPLMLYTEGMGRIRTVESSDSLFKVPVMGKPKKASVITKSFYQSTDVIGKGKGIFKIGFADRWFERDYVIESPSGTKAKIVEISSQKTGDYWEYELKLFGPNQNATVPFKDLQPGTKWGKFSAPVGIAGSRGNGARNQAPAMMQNQCTFIRMSYNYKGNVQNKVMTISIPTASGATKYWVEWEAYQHQLNWKEECENVLWYSEWNRDSQGFIHDHDINSGEIITMGSGVLEQIPNSSTYAFLTEEKISRTIRDVFYNSSATAKKDIFLYTGIGGMEEWHKALLAATKSLGFQATSDKFVGGSANSYNMVYGSYFGTYKHKDGHTITVKQLPLLDYGYRAEIAPKHPITGLPITSYDMYFIDQSTIDGKPNLEFLAEKGREDIEVFVPGLTLPKGYTGTSQRATDADQASVHFAKSLGVHIYCPTNCFKMFCNLS